MQKIFGSVVAGLTGLAFALTGGQASGQTLYGPGGLFVHPTAYVTGGSAFHINVSYFTQKQSDENQAEYMPASLAYRINPRAEIGALYLHRRFGTSENESGGLFGKVQFLADDARHPALALTGSFLGGDIRQGTLALTASRAFRRGDRTYLVLHTGLQVTRWQDNDSPSPSTSLSVFTGLVVPIRSGFALLGEVGSRFAFDSKETSSFGLQYTARSGYSLGVGFVNTGRGDENRFFVGVGFPTGG